MPRSITVALLLFAFATLCWLGLSVSIKNIEQDIFTRSSDALDGAGFADIDVSVDGRDVTLSGVVDAPDEIVSVETAVSDVWGVRVVASQLDVVQRPQPPSFNKPKSADATGNKTPVPTEEYSLKVVTDGASVVIGGHMPSADAIQALRGSVVSRFANVPVVLEVKDDSRALPAAQRGLELFGVEQLSHLAVGTLEINPISFSLKGEAASQEKLNTINTGIERLKSLQPTLNINTDLRVAKEMAGSACQRQIDDIMQGQRVEFASGRAQISRKSYGLLNSIVAIIKRCDVLLEISGHTDSQGSDAANRYLSERRALAVERYFLLNNVSARKLTSVGIGEIQPIADNSTAAGRAENRRIEFRVIKGAQ